MAEEAAPAVLREDSSVDAPSLFCGHSPGQPGETATAPLSASASQEGLPGGPVTKTPRPNSGHPGSILSQELDPA